MSGINSLIVRMREPSEGNTEEENKKYGFPEMKKLGRALVKPAR